MTRTSAPDVDEVDKTGAGDALTGAFLALWLNAVAPDDALRYACAAGSLVVTRLGAQELRPASQDLIRILPSDDPAVPTRRIIAQE